MAFLILALLAGAVHPPEDVRLTQKQMFELQQPYRYHVQTVEVLWHSGLNRYQAEIRDYYANTLKLQASRPEGETHPTGTAMRVNLYMEDTLAFPEERYYHTDIRRIISDSPIILVIEDRTERISLWPLDSPDP